MVECIKFKEANCKNCYKCIRHCPVKSIRFSDDKVSIINEECILCGNCYVVCPQNAKEIRNDVSTAKALLRSGVPVYASIAPSFVAYYGNVTINSMEKVLKELGFAGIEETAVGATIVKKQYERMTHRSEQEVIISSCCHTVNLLIQKYYPKVLPYLANIVSPMQAHSIDIKHRFPGSKTVFIGPCISKKAEAESYGGIVDCVLTFQEFSLWLKEEKMQLEYIEDANNESRARFFPTTGGILKTMSAANPDYTYIAIDGIENCILAIEDVIKGKLNKCFIEMSACTGSCSGGPIMDKDNCSPIKNYISISRYAGNEDFPVSDYEEKELKKDMSPQIPRQVYLGGKAIEEVLKKMGKTKPEDELNCGSCGYNTCRDKAHAVLQGKANLHMCLPYLKEKAESFSDNIIKNTPNGIIVLNESFEVQQINAAACRMMNIRNPKDILGDNVVCILDPQPFVEAYEKGTECSYKATYLPEYSKYVDQTIIYDKSYHIIICIMRDVTEETLQREKKEALSRNTIEVTDKVIEKQMRAVQEIASLLGETTAETKIALTKLKESLMDE